MNIELNLIEKKSSITLVLMLGRIKTNERKNNNPSPEKLYVFIFQVMKDIDEKYLCSSTHFASL